jgi:SAM-dependent methyltransferase
VSTNGATIDTAIALAYESHMVPGILGPAAEKAVALAKLQRGEHVLDVACGTGIGARLAAARVGAKGRVAGVDVDPAMIEVAGMLARQCPAPIEWHCTSALKMPFPDGTFDVCLCLHGVQFFPDRAVGFAEMRRILKPTGRLVASVWVSLESSPAHSALVAALERQNVDTTQARKGYSFGDLGQIREAAASGGFRTIEIRTEEGCGRFRSVQAFIDGNASGSPSVGASLRKLPDRARREFIDDMKRSLASYVTEDAFTWPMHSRIVLARP